MTPTASSSSSPARMNRYDLVIEWLLIALLVFAPLAFGAVDAWSEEIVLLLATGMAVTLLLKLVAHREQPFIWSWTYLPIIAFVSLLVLQVLPLPTALIHILSPSAYQIQNDPSFPITRAGAWSTLSLYPSESWRELRLVLAVSAVFIVSLNTIRSSKQILRLLTVVAVIGMTEAMINLLQFISGTEKVLWVVPMAHLYSGTFAGHAHFGQLINLSCGAMIAIALVKMHENRPAGRKRSVDSATILFDRRYRPVWLSIICAATAFSAMCLSMTRGGMLGALFAGIITVGIASYRNRENNKKAAIITLGIVAVCSILLLTGFDAVYDKVATLGHFDVAISVRPQIFRDLIPVVKSFWLFGTGLGSHATVYPMFQTILVPAIAYNTDNEYVQLLEETGFLGLILAAVFLGMMAAAYLKIINRRQKPIRAAASGLLFGILAILIQSFSDFGQQLPSLACLTAVFCAVLVVLATLKSTDDEQQPSQPGRWSFGLRATGLTGAVVVALLFVLLPADRDRRAEAAWKDTLSYDEVARAAKWQVGDEIYTNLIASAREAVCLKPDDVRYSYWLSVYRWQSVARKAQGPADPALAALRQQTASRVVGDLLTTTRLCPTFAAPYATAAQIELFTMNRPDLADALMHKALLLGRSDPAILMPAAEMDIQLGNIDQAAPLLKDCIKADDRWESHAIEILLNKDRSDLAIQICQDHAGQLADILTRLPKAGQPATPTQIASRASVISNLAALSQQPDTEAWVLAVLAENSLQQNDPATASKYYQQALEKDYRQVDWRLGLARSLVATGQTDAAVAEIRACERMAPERDDVRNYLQEILNHPHAIAMRSVG